MKQATEWKIAAVIICLVVFTSFAQAQENDESDKKLKGEVRFRYDWLGVNGDRGRFREDNWMTDGSTGGLDWLHLESTEPDENGYEWLLEGRAMHDYDYDLSFLMKKEDSHYLKLDFSSLRRYYDGSNEFPTTYGFANLSLTPAIQRLVEQSDFDYFVDRRNYNIELGLTPPEGPQWVFGWHRLVKDGREVLLHGNRGRNASDTTSFQGIPTVLNQRGITDTIYGEVFQTFADKYNFRIRQEWEQYRDSQSQWWDRRHDFDGTLDGSSADRGVEDDLGYTNWRTMFMFDSFLNDETYVTANYMYNYLNNDSMRLYFRKPSQPVRRQETSVSRSRSTNVGALGYRKANAMNVPSLDFTVSIRIEDSKTLSQNQFLTNSGSGSNMSQLDEIRVGETIRLVYKGIERTTLSFDADLEQRDLGWKDDEDGDLSRADIDFLDQVYTFKAVHRFNRAVKSTVKFRIKDLERSYTEFVSAPGGYPGWLGDYRRAGEDITVKTDFRINRKTSSTLMYQYVHEDIDFELGGKTSNQQIHRGLGSLSFSPSGNLFLVGTFMLENYDIYTPAIDPSPGLLDFRGNSFSLLLDGTYAFNSKTSCTLGVRHTEALGTTDYAGNYAFDTVSVMANHKMAANQTVGLGYRFYNFNNHRGGGFDDYCAHGAFVTYSYTF